MLCCPRDEAHGGYLDWYLDRVKEHERTKEKKRGDRPSYRRNSNTIPPSPPPFTTTTPYSPLTAASTRSHPPHSWHVSRNHSPHPLANSLSVMSETTTPLMVWEGEQGDTREKRKKSRRVLRFAGVREEARDAGVGRRE